MAITSSGAVRATPTQKRRVMSRSSGFSSCVAVTVRGSRAMPQMGHDPGPGRTIWGCMGHVYSVRVAARGTSGSRAMPQEGQAPGLGSWTSGHMGQTKERTWASDLGFRASEWPGFWHAKGDESRGLVQVFRGVGFEFLCAAGAAEVVIFSAVFVSVFGGGGIDVHPTDGVAFGSSGIRDSHGTGVDSNRYVLFDWGCTILDSSGGSAGTPRSSYRRVWTNDLSRCGFQL